jgi:hypothetical protein
VCLCLQVPEEEKQALLSLKQGITEDPFGILRVWDKDSSPCQPPGWTGVKCRCDAAGCQVVELDIGSAQLRGKLTEDVGKLKNLEVGWDRA